MKTNDRPDIVVRLGNFYRFGARALFSPNIYMRHPSCPGALEHHFPITIKSRQVYMGMGVDVLPGHTSKNDRTVVV
jgi:hypothetical protein